MIAAALKSFFRCAWFWPLPVFADFGHPGWVLGLIYFAIIVNLKAAPIGYPKVEESIREQIKVVVNMLIIALLSFYNAFFSPLVFLMEPKLVAIDPLSDYTIDEQLAISWIDCLDRMDIEQQMPISFRGKVLDIAGNPIPNATIGYGPGNRFRQSGLLKRKTLSDAKGQFQISGIRGTQLQIQIFSDGFQGLSETYDSLDYRSPHFIVSDRENVLTLQPQVKHETTFAKELYVWHGDLPNADKCFISPLSGKSTLNASAESICITRENINLGGIDNPVASLRFGGLDGIKVKKTEDYVESIAGFPLLPGPMDVTINFLTREGNYGSINIWGRLSKNYGERLGYTISYNPSGSPCLNMGSQTQILNPIDRISSPNGESIPPFCGSWSCQSYSPPCMKKIYVGPLGNYISLFIYDDEQIRYDATYNRFETFYSRSKQWVPLIVGGSEKEYYWIQISPNQIVIPEGSYDSWLVCTYDPKTDKLTHAEQDSKNFHVYLGDFARSK